MQINDDPRNSCAPKESFSLLRGFATKISHWLKICHDVSSNSNGLLPHACPRFFAVRKNWLLINMLTLGLIAGSATSQGQPLTEAWVQRFNRGVPSTDFAQKAAVDPSGNVIVAGYSDAYISDNDWLVIKYSGAGAPLWTNRYNGPANGDDEAAALAVDGSGNVFVTGYCSGSSGGKDYTTIAYSAAGNALWTNYYNGPGNLDDQAMAIAVDSGGNVLVTGTSTNNGSLISYVTIKYSGAGVPVWTNLLSGPEYMDNYAPAIGVDGSGGVFVAGGIYTNFVSDFLTIKYAADGLPLWTNRYNGTSYGADRAKALAVDGSGNVVVTGSSADLSGYPDYATIKYSGAGVPLWTNRFTGPPNAYSYDEPSAVAVDSGGKVFVTGYSWGIDNDADYATIAYSSAGVPLWTNRYDFAGGNDYAVAVAVDGGGDVLVAGSSAGSLGASDYATIKYSGAGVVLWTKRFGTNNGYSARSLAMDGSGNVFVTGGGSFVAGFLTVAYSSAGALLWTNSYAGIGNGDDEPAAMVVDGSGNVIVTGTSFDLYQVGDYETIAYSSAGVALWTNYFNGPGDYDDEAAAIAVDSGGNVFVTGGSFNGQSGFDYATIKYSSAGMPLWTNYYNGTANGGDAATALAVDSNGNVIVTGNSTGPTGLSSYVDFATIKYSSAGAPLWTNRYNGPGNDADTAVGVAVDGSGNVIVAGSSASGFDVDYVTIKYSSAGVPLWTNRYGAASGSVERARAMTMDSAGDVLVFGTSEISGAQDWALVKYSGTGMPLWTNRYHGTFSGADFAYSVAVDLNRNVFATGTDGGFGSTTGGPTLVKYSPNGMALWTNHYDGGVQAVRVDGSGNVIVAGSSPSAFNDDYVTIAYSNAGIPLWTNRYNGPADGDDVPLTQNLLAIAPDGSVYVSGASDGDYTSYRNFDFATVKYAVVPSAPLLHIARAGTSVIVSWPTTAGAFHLQENTNLTTASSWTAVTHSAVTNGGQTSLTLPSGSGKKFFRLLWP
jgi:uncharacterized delta-60 repeat protein